MQNLLDFMGESLSEKKQQKLELSEDLTIALQ